jgi:TPR repeat protein
MTMKSKEIKPRPLLPLLFVVFLMVWGAAFLYFRAPIESRAERGYAEPQYQLGKCYFYGIGVNRNYPQAAK